MTTRRPFVLSALVVLLAVAGPARLAGDFIDPARYDLRPLLRLQAVGYNIIGEPFEIDAAIDRGGPTLYAYTAVTGDACRVARGVGESADLQVLNQALAAAHVGQLQGGCGGPAPDYVSRYTLTWYGTGGRVRTLQVGGIYADCPAEVQAVFDAACAYLWQTVYPALEYCAPPLP